jgi:hypothetical protein
MKGVGDSAYWAVRFHGRIGTRERFIKLGCGEGSVPQPASYHAQLFINHILWALKRESDREVEGGSRRPGSKGKEIGCVGCKCDSRSKLNRGDFAINWAGPVSDGGVDGGRAIACTERVHGTLNICVSNILGRPNKSKTKDAGKDRLAHGLIQEIGVKGTQDAQLRGSRKYRLWCQLYQDGAELLVKQIGRIEKELFLGLDRVGLRGGFANSCIDGFASVSLVKSPGK